jgi:hypothetical protein
MQHLEGEIDRSRESSQFLRRRIPQRVMQDPDIVPRRGLGRAEVEVVRPAIQQGDDTHDMGLASLTDLRPGGEVPKG